MKVEVHRGHYGTNTIRLVINGKSIGWSSYFRYNINPKVYLMLRTLTHLTKQPCIKY